MTRVEAADEVLGLVVRLGGILLPPDVAPISEALELFRDSGVTFREPDEPDDETETASVNRADIEPRTILGEALAPLGFSVGEARDGFVSLFRADLPPECGLFFLERRDVPPYAILPIARRVLTIVFHVDDEVVDDTYNEFGHALGIHVVRLREAAGITGSQVAALLAVVETVTNALPRSERLEISETHYLCRSPPKISEYASTRNRIRKREWATAAIIAPLVKFSVSVRKPAFIGLPFQMGF